MGKNDSKENLVWFGIIIAIAVFFIVSNNDDSEAIQNEKIIETLETSYIVVPGETCTLSISPSRIPAGRTIIGTIVDGKNTLCELYAKTDGDWTLAWSGVTNAEGVVSESGTLDVAGTYSFRAICGSCVTDVVSVVVDPRDSDDDGFSDDEEESEGTDPNDPNDFPGSEEEDGDSDGDISYTCGINYDCSGTCPTTHPFCEPLDFSAYDACACINGLSEVHPDWKPDGVNHHPQLFDGEQEPQISYNCDDADAHLDLAGQLSTASYCVDDFGTHYDACDPYNTYSVIDWYCVTLDGSYECDGSLSRSCDYFVGEGSTCTAGECTAPPPDYYDLTDATYWVHYDSLMGGSPIRMRGDFLNWDFDTSSSGSGSENYATLTVTITGTGGTSISIPISGHVDFNLNSIMHPYDGQSRTVIFESKFASGYIRDKSQYTGLVNFV